MKIKGSVEEIRFRNDENGYTIAVVDVDGDPLVCVGTFPPVSEGENVNIEGEIVMHNRFGRQLKASKVIVDSPSSTQSLVRYLGSGILHGIGPKTALAIVSKFGEKTLDIFEFQPARLAEIRGITKERAMQIGGEYSKIKGMKDAVMFLQSKGLSLNMAVRIFKVFSQNTIATVQSNPYTLIEAVDGIGFLTADRIALEIGIKKDSRFRINAGVICVLKESGEKNGNTFLPEDIISAEAEKLLKCGIDDYKEILDELVISGKLRHISFDDADGYALKSTYLAEKNAALRLVKLKEEANRIAYDCTDDIAMFEKLSDIRLHGMQRTAIETAVNNGVAIITGGPGTGKTTIIKCIVSVFENKNINVLLMAPTGRAAKRLSESTGKASSTIHRALMLSPNSDSSGECLECDAVIVDEVSMVDIYLLNTLLSRLRQGARLILVGDKDQLPSVGAGNVISDIMASKLIPIINLTEIYRQSEQSLITLNAHRINRGEMPELDIKDKDFFFIKATSAEDICARVIELITSRLPTYLNCEPQKIQILSPMKNGAAGVVNLNSSLARLLNKSKTNIELHSDEQSFKVGDKVMHIANNYSLEWKRNIGYQIENGEGVFNGDLGFVQDIKTASGEMDVLFEDGRLVTYTPDVRHQLILAYAITVHKSQGSEFDAVIIPIATVNSMIMTRNLLYTAITRAKKVVVLVGEEYNIKRMVDNNYIAKRFSALKNFMIEAAQKNGLLFGIGD